MTRKQQIIVAISAPLAVILVYVFRDFIMSLAPVLGECMFHKMTGLWCPGCGNTRSVNAMLHGHFLLALRENISLPVIAVLLLALYIELVSDIFGRKVTILTRKAWVWWTVLALFGVYFIVRNFIPAIAPI
ncbi:MAG: DUF2752 domain-containing protein [Ruminococcus flavefaciens]|nr:DUF2752 domain-containing protein [Ruminococcus flavefaciens]MCM1229406.1 DUF2752 domain-containing protein [Ruminococcus flavefaciens]